MEEVPPDLTHMAPSITESPFFIVGIVIVVIIIGVVLRRFVFDNTHDDYKHNPDD